MAAPLAAEVTLFLIVFARIGAFVMLLPGLGDDMVPARLRLVLALLTSLVVLPAVSLHLPPVPQSDPALLALMLGEIAVGLMMGAVVRMLFAAVTVTGTIVGLQSGLAAAALFDPIGGMSNPVIARFLGIAGVVLMFAAGIHHLLLTGIVRSYMSFMPGAGVNASDVAQLGIDGIATGFAIGLQLAAPFLIYGILFNLGLGLMARLAPSVQVFFIAQPLNLLLAFALLLATSGLMLTLFIEAFRDALSGLM